ncbi:MAG: bifunctional riboflavin kinase/FAD synthetase [Planctomycetia bacterium]|nr:bifunctional riboflavin kinase/FAD synthetase [Planctomycetia bacterium]
MQLLRSLDNLPPDCRGGAVAIGNFDGVHRGHARIVERLLANAREVGGPAVVFTFDPHPAMVLRPEAAPQPLTWIDRKAELLAALGVDGMIAFPTDEALLALEAEEFFDRIVLQKLQAKALVEGPNFAFGRGRRGTIELLRDLSRKAAVKLEVVEPIWDGDEIVSSSRVRRLVAAGDVAEAGRLLTAPYRIRGLVTHGAGRGAKIGFPTANLAGVDTLLPAQGVYAGRAERDGRRVGAAINVGPNPTFGEQAAKIEVHLLNYSGSLYGQTLEVDFLARLRDIRPFADVSALTAQLAEDVADADRIAAVCCGTVSRP